MRQWYVLMSLLLPILLTGCANDQDLRVLQANTSALQRQSSALHQTMASRLQQLSDRIARSAQSQAEIRRDVAQAAATLDELRVQLQRLQGDIQETQHLMQRGVTEGVGVSATTPSEVETRLRALEKQLGVATP
jgi:hypothetical protein